MLSPELETRNEKGYLPDRKEGNFREIATRLHLEK
jgi:hypothetical protein